MNFFLHIISTISIGMPAVLGYTFVFGRAKILHFGPIGVAIVSAYGTFLTLSATNNYLFALVAGITAASLCSLLFAWLSFRLEPDGLGILSIAAHLTLVNIVLNWQSLTRGALGIPRIPRLSFLETPEQFAAFTTLICIAWILFFLWINRTSMARQLSALAEQEWHAKALGINKIRIHLIAFLILGLTLASDNFFHVQYYRILYPTEYLFPTFIALMMMVVAGKPGSVWGGILATIALTFVKEALRLLPLPTDVLGPLRLLIFGIILLAAIRVQRDTLFPQKRTI